MLSPFVLSVLYDHVVVKCKLVGEKGGEGGGGGKGEEGVWVSVDVFPFDSLRSIKSKVFFFFFNDN